MSDVYAQPASRRGISHIVVHCSATAQGQSVNAFMVDNWHRDRGFKRQPEAVLAFNPQLPHIGYHWLIDLQGRVVPGRAEAEVGAHVSGSNAHSIGVCLVGTVRFTRAQWDALAVLVLQLQDRYPGAVVLGHRDLSPDLNGDGQVTQQEWIKICPGFHVGWWLNNGMRPAPLHVTVE